MTLDHLRTLLPHLGRAEVSTIFHAWSRRGPGEPEDIVAWLHAREAIPEDAVLSVARESPVILDDHDVPRPSSARPLGRIGRGGMGEVWLCRDEALHRTIAVKRLTGHGGAPDPAARRRFIREAQLTAQLDHPGIVAVHGLESGGDPSYSMKLIRGRTLAAWLDEARAATRRGSPRALREGYRLAARLELFTAVCEPVAYAHARGVIHRDLKPDNVMIGTFGEVLVVDWGIGRVIGQPDDAVDTGEYVQSVDGTALGDVVGTVPYMSPEQARGENDKVDARSDQFSLGLLLYELVTLQRARALGGAPEAMLAAATRGDVPRLPRSAPGGEPIPRELRAVVRRATAADPTRRYASVGDLAADVRRVVRGDAVLASPDSTLQRVTRSALRHRERVAGAIGAIALLTLAAFGLLIGAGSWVREQDRRAAAEEEARRLDAAAVAQERARALDAMLFRQEGLVRGLAAAARRAIAHPPSGAQAVYLAAAFAHPSSAPPDLAESAVYRGRASVAYPDLAVAPGLDPTTPRVVTLLRALASLQPELEATLLGSLPDTVPSPATDVDARQRILSLGTPAVWSYVASADGVLVGYPGVGSYPPEYDPRRQPWYHEGIGRTGPGWGRPYVDESGMGLLISCTTPLLAPDERVIGVVGLDLSVRSLAGDWLSPGADADGYLVDDQGNVVIASAGGQNLQAAVGVVPFPDQAGLAAIVANPTHGQAVSAGHLLAWSRLGAVPWTYVTVD